MNNIPQVPRTFKVLFALSLLTALVFVISGYGYQWDIWSLGTGFSMLRNSAYATFVLIPAILLATLFMRSWLTGNAWALVILSLLMAGSIMGTAYYWDDRGDRYPAIHDLTTDIDNPPAFDELVQLRENSPNPPEYVGGETAELQREHYPDLEPLYLDASKDRVFEAALQLVMDRGWEVARSDANSGMIEATEELPWFGFKDDVVVRVQEINRQVRVDMRSKSRIGQHDFGVNALRIKRYLRDLRVKVH